MNIEISYFLLVNIGLVSSLNCYSCTGSTGCNDPFNSLGSGVATTGSVSTNTFCIKRRYINTYERLGASTCTGYVYSSNSYEYCCQTDFCNSTRKLVLDQIFLFFFLIWIFDQFLLKHFFFFQ